MTNYNRRTFLGSSIAGALTAKPQPAQPATGKRRNILFILTDDHRYDAMSFMGAQTFPVTPNMDAMARDGVHCVNAFVTTALCSPSRASILTGKYAHQHRIVDNNTAIPPGTHFFSQDLQKAGYA